MYGTERFNSYHVPRLDKLKITPIHQSGRFLNAPSSDTATTTTTLTYPVSTRTLYMQSRPGSILRRARKRKKKKNNIHTGTEDAQITSPSPVDRRSVIKRGEWEKSRDVCTIKSGTYTPCNPDPL